MIYPLTEPNIQKVNSLPKIVLLDKRSQYFPIIASYVYYQVTQKLYKQNKIPICNTCNGLGYLYNGKSLIYWIEDTVALQLGEIAADLIDGGNISKYIKIISEVYNVVYNILTTLEVRATPDEPINLYGLKKCPVCKATGTQSLYLEQFGDKITDAILSTLTKKGLLTNNISRAISQVSRQYLNNPTFKNKKYRKQLGEYSTKRRYKNRFIADLTKEVVGDFNAPNSFVKLIHRFSRVDTGAMKRNMFVNKIGTDKQIKKVIISTKARKISKNFPDGFLYASLYSNFKGVGKKSWSKSGITTQQLFDKSFKNVINRYGLRGYSKYKTELYRLISLFNWQDK